MEWQGGARLERRWRERRRLIAVGTASFALLLLTPRSGRDGPREIGPAEAEIPTCRLGVSCPEPGPDGWSARMESLLEARAPGLPEGTRRRVARAVVEESLAAGLDPLLTAAIIDVESGYDSRAVSWVGARGLMQLLPGTMAREAARNGMAAGDPYDPVANVRLGIRYFRRLLDVFEREDHALMAYNAGPNRLGEYLQRGKVPASIRAYPVRVFAEQQRLRQGFGLVPATATAIAEAGHPAVAW